MEVETKVDNLHLIKFEFAAETNKRVLDLLSLVIGALICLYTSCPRQALLNRSTHFTCHFIEYSAHFALFALVKWKFIAVTSSKHHQLPIRLITLGAHDTQHALLVDNGKYK